MKIRLGRWTITTQNAWIQTTKPMQVWHIPFLWVIRESRFSDIDKFPRFPLGTKVVTEDGRVYLYWRAGKEKEVENET